MLSKLLALAISASLSSAAIAATSFSDDFNDQSLSANWLDLSSGYTEAADGTLTNTATTSTGDGFSDQKYYVRTVDTDYINSNFIAEITVQTTTNEIAYFGFGDAAQASAVNEGHGINQRIHGDTIGAGVGQVDLAWTPTTGLFVIDTSGASFANALNGTHRARLSRNGDMLSAEFDQNYNGVFFADGSATLDLSTITGFDLDASNSSIYFGSSQSGTKFDDFSVSASTIPAVAAVPEPSTYALMTTGLLLLVYANKRKKANF